jgi:hypothetical protein
LRFRVQIFFKDKDYQLFESILIDGVGKYSSFYKRFLAKKSFLSKPPINLPDDYRQLVQVPLTPGELESTRLSVNKGKPFGKNTWTEEVIKMYKLGITIRERGRPRKGT